MAQRVTSLSYSLAFSVNRLQNGSKPFLKKGVEYQDKMCLGDTQSEERKSFKPPFLLLLLSSRMSILLRRWTTQFFALEGGLEEEEPDPGVLEEVEDLEGEREREKKRVGR